MSARGAIRRRCPTSLAPEYYQRIARTLEDAKFHMAFFDDRLAMPDIYGDDHREAVANGIRCVKMDPTIVLMAMAAVTEPARPRRRPTRRPTTSRSTSPALFATLDLMTDGRVAWNVVTSLNNSEAENFGHEEHLEHDLRYDRADEFMEVVTGHWDTWEDDALILDKQSGRFADPAKVHRLDHRGKYFKSQGPVHRAALAAGPSGAHAGGPERPRHGLRASWAELVFASYPTLEVGRKNYAYLKDEVDEGRPRSGAVQDRAGSEGDRRRDRGAGRGAARAHGVDGQADRFDGAAVRGAERRLRQVGLRPAVHRPGAGLAVLAEPARQGDRQDRQEEPVGARLRRGLGPRPAQRRPGVLRHAEPGRRRDGGMVQRRRATASCCPARAFRAPTRTSHGWSCPSCSGAACSGREYPGTTLRDTLGLPRPATKSWRQTIERRRA